MAIKTKNLESDILVPKATPDGSSLEEKVNAFLLTITDPKNILDVQFGDNMAGHIGLSERHFAHVLYKE